MMRVRFKNTRNIPSRVVTHPADRITKVSIRGTVSLPKFWRNVPREILEWMESHEHVETYESLVSDELIIKAEGYSTCHEEDVYDGELGRKIAESRARKRIYGFMYTLCKKLEIYYRDIIFGNYEISFVSPHDTAPKSCVFSSICKYHFLFNKETDYLNSLINESYTKGTDQS